MIGSQRWERHTQGHFLRVSPIVKEILLSEVDSDKKKVDEFMDSLKGLIDQDYFKNIVDEELKILRGNIQGWYQWLVLLLMQIMMKIHILIYLYFI